MMRARKGYITVFILAAVLSLFFPIQALFTGEGDLVWHMTQPATYKMLIEIVLLFAVAGSAARYMTDSKKFILVLGGIFILFCWLHENMLPMLISALYLGHVILVGRFLRTKLLKVRIPYAFFSDFLLGCSLVISEFCMLSAFQVGGIENLRLVSLVQGTVLTLLFLQEFRKSKVQTAAQKCFLPDLGRYERLLLVFIFVMVLIQIGKMNVTLDFDSRWYGLRSQYVLNFGKGIYENPGMVGMTYVYSKGLEVLCLPLADLVSHSYILFINVWVTVIGIGAVYRLALFYMSSRSAFFAAALTSAVPGVMNMSISAKSDNITWCLQLIMMIYLVSYTEAVLGETPQKKMLRKGSIRKDRCPVELLILAVGSYLLSLTMKPTALVFSTALLGMSGLYLIFSKKVSLKASLRHWLLLVPALTALIGIWARTFVITGMPVTSVFTSVFAKLGFQMRYPFATGALPQNGQGESAFLVLGRRLYQMLLSPTGKDMGHVVIAWGSSLIFFLLVLILAAVLMRKKNAAQGKKKSSQTVFVHTVFWPFLAVNMVSLTILYQVDGNYFTLLYTAIILFACFGLESFPQGAVKSWAQRLMIPVLVLNILLSSITNWAWALGFSDIKLINSGRMNHRELQHQELISGGNEEIWKILAHRPDTKVISFGSHPQTLEFPCIVQSYKDITSPWGNVELVNTPEAFEEYMVYAKTDFVYAEAGYMGETEWSWSYGLLKDLISRGVLTELRFEQGNMLASVNRELLNGKSLEETGVDTEKNITLFIANYETAAVKGE